MTVLAPHLDAIRAMEPRRIRGRVAAVRGLSLLVDQLPLPVGALVRLAGRGHGRGAMGEVVGFDGGRSVVMLLGSVQGVAPGEIVVGERAAPVVPVGDHLLGRVIDGLGRPLDAAPPPRHTALRPLTAAPPAPHTRARVVEPLWTGIRAIDAMVTIGRGQRVGIFSGAGVGKSTLLAAIARDAVVDVIVIALIGERGREVRDLTELVLPADERRRAVLVASTGDESPLLRVRAALTACAVAEHFRDHGASVLLMMDSVTRYAQARRQIGLTAGEPAAARGFTPSVFADLPALLERAGPVRGGGSITGMYTVLMEADDPNEPIADAVRGMLDGHIVLSRAMAARGQYPAVDPVASVSRVADDVVDEQHVTARRRIRESLATYGEVEELVRIGAYGGADPRSDSALALKPALDAFLTQPLEETSPPAETRRRLLELAGVQA